jgi:hypothetical protein
MKKIVPYDFVFDYLPRNVIVKQAFGMYYIYLNKKIVLILRKLTKNLNLNGIWIATGIEYHVSLKKEVQCITHFTLDNGKVHDSAWQLIKEDAGDFETAAIKICDLISHGDKRIGKETKKGASL